MIDLDTLQLLEESQDESLYLIFAQWLIERKVDYQIFQKLAKWINCYHYVCPAYRVRHEELMNFLWKKHKHDAFFLALLISHIEANLTWEMQDILYRRF